jgi:hypothetical protein
MSPIRVAIVLVAGAIAFLPAPALRYSALASPGPPPVLIAWEGATAPGLGGTFASFSPSDVNDAGQAAFYARNGGGDCGLYLGDGTSLTMLAGPGMLTADGPLGTQDLCPGGVLPSRPPLVNSAIPLVAFQATVGGLSGIYANVGATPAPPYSKWARQSEPAPGGGAYGSALDLDDVSDIGGGQVLFRSPVVGGGCAAQGLFLATGPGSVTVVARGGGGAGGCGADTAPTGGVYASIAASGMNNSGRVVFQGTAPIGDEIDRTDSPYTARVKVAADGDTWAADPAYGNTLDLLPVSGMNSGPSIDGAGQVVFRAASATYGEGYYMAPSTDQKTEDGAGAGSCVDGVDNGPDGFTDAADADCAQEDGAGNNSCYDGIDNGADGVADASDPDCAAAYQAQVAGTVVSADPSVLGGTFTPCPGDPGILRGAGRGLIDAGQLIAIGCGADPTGIIAFPSFQKLVKDAEALPAPLTGTFTSFADAAASSGSNGKISFGAQGTASCAPSTAPCTGIFVGNAGADR